MTELKKMTWDKNLKDTHKNSSKCLTDGRTVNKKAPNNVNCSKNSRGCGPEQQNKQNQNKNTKTKKGVKRLN
jgi:hypothetical protein